MLPDRYLLRGLLKRFVQQHDGRVKVMQSIQTSPCFEEEEKRAEHPVVLVIDDQPAILDMLSWMLSFYGYQAVCTTNGQEALEWMKSALHTGQYPVRSEEHTSELQSRPH